VRDDHAGAPEWFVGSGCVGQDQGFGYGLPEGGCGFVLDAALADVVEFVDEASCDFAG
jgi:hypothetical protein